MAKKQSNNPLRWLIATGSIVGFLGGWVILGNATEINSATTATQNASTINSTTSNNNATASSSTATSSGSSLTPLSTQSSTTGTTSRVRMRTGGS